MYPYDIDYRNRVAIAVYKAVIEESKGDADVAFIQTGTAFDALMMVATVIMAGSPQFKNAHDIRIFCEETCKKMRNEIAAARADPDRASLFGESYEPGKAN